MPRGLVVMCALPGRVKVKMSLANKFGTKLFERERVKVCLSPRSLLDSKYLG